MTGELLLFPQGDKAVLHAEVQQRDGRQPQQASPHQETGPEQEIAQVERIAGHEVWPGVHERSEPSCACPGDHADVADRPESRRLAQRDQRGPQEPKPRPVHRVPPDGEQHDDPGKR